jgi:allene oxide cyclase-like protein
MMGRRLGVLGAAIAVVALAVGVVSPALGSSGDDDGQRTIRVVSVLDEEAFVDLGDQGESVGDQFVFSSRFLKGGEQVGHDAVVCTIVSLERQEAQCIATAWFDDGQITAQALVSFAEDPPVVSITGGSGKYKGAEGGLHIRPVSETKEILIFRLEE